MTKATDKAKKVITSVVEHHDCPSKIKPAITGKDALLLPVHSKMLGWRTGIGGMLVKEPALVSVQNN